MPMSNPGEPSRFIRPRARGEQEVDVDKAKQIKLIKGARVTTNLALQRAGARGIISCGQRRAADMKRDQSCRSSMSFNLRLDFLIRHLFLAGLRDLVPGAGWQGERISLRSDGEA